MILLLFYFVPFHVFLLIIPKLFLFNYFFISIFLILLLAETNRVPYDLPEAESELVAGFITEYSTIYFSLILLTEYASIISFAFLIIFIFNLYPLSIVFFLCLISLIRSTLNRLKFDELMTSA